jgi:hypothetical protein
MRSMIFTANKNEFLEQDKQWPKPVYVREEAFTLLEKSLSVTLRLVGFRHPALGSCEQRVLTLT